MNMESNEKPIINRIKVVLVENREGQTNGWQTLLEKTAQQFQNGVPIRHSLDWKHWSRLQNGF